jgi:predicted RNase H-like nuclease
MMSFMDSTLEAGRRNRGAGVGVDGCRAGWLYAAIDADDDCRFGVLQSFEKVIASLHEPQLVLVDIPIGLPSPGQSGRQCDRLARRAIGPRGSSVFTPPGRAAIEAPAYEAACLANQRLHGQKISLQSWNIAPKIGEVDHFLRNTVSPPAIREMHPEVAFWALNGRVPLPESKKSAAGLDARLDVLERHFRPARECYERCLAATARADVARDDIVDALVGAVTAIRAPRLACFPGQPPRDEFGLSMEIVFADPDVFG